MPKITFTNFDKTVEAHSGETILDIALANDVPLQHACGGFCSCTTCHVIVRANPAGLAPMEEDEQERIQDVDGQTATSRLGCQAKLVGDVTVEIVNVDEY